MTNRQRLEIQVAKAKKELRELALADDSTSEAIEAKTTELSNLEARAAALPEPEPEPEQGAQGQGQAARRRGTGTPRACEAKSSVASYLAAAMDRGRGRGRGRVQRFARHGCGIVPASAARAPERRATTDADALATRGRWVDRLFGDSAARWMGVSMPSVRPGTATYPVTTAGASASQRGRGEAAPDTAWTVGVTDAKPSRNVVSAKFAVEDAARLPGVEDAVRRELRMALVDGIDKAIFLGDAGANENTADITGLNTSAGVVEEELTQAQATSAIHVLAAFTNMVDGLAAAMLGDLRAVLSVGAYRAWVQTLAVAGQEMTLNRFLEEAGLPQVRVREGISTVTTANSFAAFVGRQRGIMGCGVAPVWGGCTADPRPLLGREDRRGYADPDHSLELQAAPRVQLRANPVCFVGRHRSRSANRESSSTASCSRRAGPHAVAGRCLPPVVCSGRTRVWVS